MKIALVNASDFGGGAERSVVSLHQGLRSAGHESTLYVGEKKTDLPGVVLIPYVRGVPGSRRIARWLERTMGWMDIYNPGFRNLASLIPNDTDVVHFNNLWGGGGFADLAALPRITRRIPGVATEHQTWLFTGHCAYFRDCMRWKTGCGYCPDLTIPPAIPRDGTRRNWQRKKRLIARSNLTLVGISDWVRQLGEQSPIWAGKRIVRIYEGIDTDTFHPVKPEVKMMLRAELGIPENRVAVLVTGQTLGGFVDGFAPHGLEAVGRLDSETVCPILVGRTSEEAAAPLGMKSVTLPFQATPEAMAKCYQAADLNVSASRVEAFGCIPAESQACGTPVVAFDSGGLAEVVQTGVGGLSVPFGDTDGLVAAIRRLVCDTELRERLGRQGRDYVVRNFAVSEVVRQHVELYVRIVQDRGAA